LGERLKNVDVLEEEAREESWFDDYAEDVDDTQIDEYDITAAPNDFNVLTLQSFIESGAVKIPGFQRNFVWDISRASKLIESLVLGLPVPQVFLYEQQRNAFLVIDGQQRLMSIYYFIKKRFPRKEKRVELRTIFEKNGGIPESILFDDLYFQSFNLQLAEKLPNRKNKFKGLNYSTLDDYKKQFELRPIRCIIVKQNAPTDDDSSMYEIFNRLNTGGINLRPQEIRTSMYHSDFYEVLYAVNSNVTWRKILHSESPDLHMKDIEILLRGFAMLIEGDEYSPSMVRFLNRFSRKSEKNDAAKNEYLKKLFISFTDAASILSENAFINRRNNRFNIALYEAVFTATCEKAFKGHRLLSGQLKESQIEALASDVDFASAALEGTTGTANVDTRLKRARLLLTSM
jgi:uncharacterized protein with ParB-like and HNH nuclease domain